MAKENQKINWDLFSSFYFKPTEIPTDIQITDWRDDVSEFNGEKYASIKFKVNRENNKSVDKEFSSTSKRLAHQLKPLFDRAESDGRESLNIRISRTGDGKSTQFVVREI